MKLEHKRIVVPAGVVMTRVSDGHQRTHNRNLVCKANRQIDPTSGEPVDDLWLFPWIGKMYSVPQHLVKGTDDEAS